VFGTACRRATEKNAALNADTALPGARMVGLCGWDMPVEYSGITSEHMAVCGSARASSTSATWARFEIAGKDALAAVQRISCNDASKLQPGQAQYQDSSRPMARSVDDLLVYRSRAAHFLLIVNASHIRRTTRTTRPGHYWRRWHQ